MVAGPLFLLFAIVLTLAVLIAHRVGRRDGYIDGRNSAARERMHSRVKNAQEGFATLSIQDFEDHCHLTVTNDLPGTPDWFWHLCAKKAGECGEFMEHVGKASRDDGWRIADGVDALTPERREYIIKEIGDGWWYDMELLRELKSSANECMLKNIAKRESRMQRGTIKGAGDDR